MTAKGAAFIRAHEGFVKNAYRDPVGIITIGTGFTNRSRIARSWFINSRGHKIRMGDRITIHENDTLLKKAMDEEYGKGVGAALGHSAPDHAKDAGTSVSFNCGPGALKWSWARLYKAGKILQSANRLKKTAVTARGRRLRGLVRRRAAEARLLEFGKYGQISPDLNRHGDGAGHMANEQLKQDQTLLNAIGYACGTPDGQWGKKTKSAVLQLQRDHGLEVDGIIGPATRAKIVRLANAKREVTVGGATGGSATGGGALGSAATTDATLQAADWLFYGGIAVLVIGGVYLAWFYRDEIPALLKMKGK